MDLCEPQLNANLVIGHHWMVLEWNPKIVNDE